MNIRKNLNVTGIILAGGKSSRMGFDKAFAEFNGKVFIDYIIEKFELFFDNILIIANDTDKYNSVPCKVIPDLIQNKGPLGGIYTGLMNTQTERNLFVACDMPFISDKSIEALLNVETRNKIIVTEFEGKLEPLFGIYSKSIADDLAIYLHKNIHKGLSVKAFLEHYEYDKFIFNQEFDEKNNPFLNINTVDDLESVKNKLKFI